jgi:hypothetical protein
MEEENKKLIDAFPCSWISNIESLLDKVVLKGKTNSSDYFTVLIDEEQINIPLRIYYEMPNTDCLTKDEIFIFNCFFTRHCDGHVREKCLKNILHSKDYIITPFVVQLLGEYFIEILQIIKEGLNKEILENIIKFKIQNPKYFDTVTRRIYSYWNCYYRELFSRRENYVGFEILQIIENHRDL